MENQQETKPEDEIPANILVDMLKKTVLEKTDQVRNLERQVETLTRTIMIYKTSVSQLVQQVLK